MRTLLSTIGIGLVSLTLPFALGASPAQDPEAAPPKKIVTQAEKPLKPSALDIPSKDGLVIRADHYAPNKRRDAPLIVLFHQAGWSRGEYLEIVPKLCRMGFNCLAVDLRSGGKINGVINETHKRAVEVKKGTEYLDALPDMQAALLKARRMTRGKVIAWGSSYSAALVLHLAGKEPKSIDGVLSFAPGEYFTKESLTFVQDAASKIECPTFITSAKSEKDGWKAIFDAILTKEKTAFLPKTAGQHGSRALWKKFEDSPAYWEQVNKFLNEHFPRTTEEKAAEKAKQGAPKKDQAGDDKTSGDKN